MKKYLVILFFVCLAGQPNLFAQSGPVQKGLDVITNQSVKAQLNFLASDWMEGRNTGTKGIAIAADYISSMFQVYGVKPYKVPQISGNGYNRLPPQIGDQGYFQDFPMYKIVPSKEHQLSIVMANGKSSMVQTFNYETDFLISGRYNPTYGGVSGEANLVFVGYGIVDEKNSYDDYKGLDVKGKILLRLRGFPGQKDTNTVAYKKFKPQTSDRYYYFNYESNKNKAALEKGALAVVELSTSADLPFYGSPKNTFRFFNGDLEFDEFPAELYNNSFSLVNDSLDRVIPHFLISKRLSYEITKKAGINIDAYEENASAKMRPASREIPAASIRFNIKNQPPEIYRGRNVLGIIEGESRDQIVVIGAHYDHKGKYNGFVWNGADDNASGTVAVMTIAKACAATGVKPKRTIVFAAWDAEEEGLLGSRYFVRNPIANDIFANINFDMISRDSEKDSLGVMCDLTYTKACDILKTSTEKDLAEYKIGLKMSYSPEDKPSGGSDYNYFAEKNIPIMAYMTAMHKDYHRPGDKPYKVNITKMANVIRIGFLNTWKLANIDKLK